MSGDMGAALPGGPDGIDELILHEIREGIPLVPRPFEAIARRLALEETEAIARLRRLVASGLIRRFGIVLRHRELGYSANAMVVWDIPDERASEAGARIGALPFVTLCYRRRRSPPVWPYNLYAMIHGRDRDAVEAQAEEATRAGGLGSCPRRILFSLRCFKQKGASYLESRVRSLDERILNRLQEGIGVEDRPFAPVARELEIEEAVLLARLSVMLADGRLSRFGPLFNVERFGGEFTLVALEVPPERFEEVAGVVNSFPEVAHNYEREHRLNMWFVIAAETPEATRGVLGAIRDRTGLEPRPLPKLEEYFLDLRLRV